MASRSIASVLGFLIISLSVSGCALLTPKPREIEISTVPVEKPKLELPKADRVRMRNVEWVVITKENYKTVFEDLAKTGRPIAVFGLTDKGYADLGLNLSDIRAYIQQQQAIIAAYERYYKEADEKLNQAVTVDKKDKK
jgi:hypothetical protein